MDDPNTSGHDDALEKFFGLFGVKGGDVAPGNIGLSRTVVATCHQIMAMSEPVLFNYFVEWDGRPVEQKLLAAERSLVSVGQWEGAWALAQLHYDQLLKQEGKAQSRLHKGHPLCNLAILARTIGSPALTRTYAMLSSAGDLYWCTRILTLSMAATARRFLSNSSRISLSAVGEMEFDRHFCRRFKTSQCFSKHLL